MLELTRVKVNFNLVTNQVYFSSMQVFQRHYGNQNLIAIIPVDQSSKSDNSCSPYSSPRTTTHHNDTSVGVSHNARMHTSGNQRPPLLKDPPSFSSVFRKQEVEEKPKLSTKFSRFEDSDSDESEDFEISNSKSDSEEEEFVIEEGEADDLIIEVEDYIVLEETDGDIEAEAQAPLPPPPAPAAPVKAVQVKPLQETRVEKKEEPPTVLEPKKREVITCLPSEKTPVSSPKKIEPRKREEEHPHTRVQKNDSDRKTETTEVVRRSPKIMSKITAPEPSRRKSSPPAVSRRSADRQKPRLADPKGAERPGSGSARRESDSRRKSRASSVEPAPNTTTLSHRFSDQWRSTNQSRSPTNDKKPQSGRRSPPQRTSVIEREPRKNIQADSERDRLESRKRKFESSLHTDLTVKKEGKIRLRTTPSPPVPQEKTEIKTRKVESVLTVVRREEVHETKEKTPNEKRNRKGKKKSKEKRTKSRSSGDKDDGK